MALMCWWYLTKLDQRAEREKVYRRTIYAELLLCSFVLLRVADSILRLLFFYSLFFFEGVGIPTLFIYIYMSYIYSVYMRIHTYTAIYTP
jgi:hypothetical protein